MPTLVKEKPLVRLNYNEMEAYLLLHKPEPYEEYTVAFLMQALAEKGVTNGIDQEALVDMINGKKYGYEILVARGTFPIDGVDGYYEYNFERELNKKPKILPDGSADYSSVRSIEQVLEGQVIAIYHPAVIGCDGISVKGKPVAAKKGREQLPLKGKGFERTEDNLTYTASIDGKIEMQNDRVMILPIHEVKGNAQISGGNIDFRGDVIIHGNVEVGVTIKATGSITIDGIAEACILEAGKDIIIRNGMLGGNKAFVKSKGNISAKFFEFTRIECEGNLSADVLMDCDVSCQGRIEMDGSRGSIIGGDIRAIRGVIVSTLGNDAEKKTHISVGAGVAVYSRLHILEKKIQAERESLEKIEKGLLQFEALEQERGVSYANDPRRMALLRVKIRDTASLAGDEAEAKKLSLLAEASRGACVSVLLQVFPGVIIDIDDMKLTLKNVARGIEFYKLPDKIATRPCYQGVE